MDLFYFILISFGLTQILVHATIFNKIRPEHHFFHCSMCVGFWVGVFLVLINPLTELINFRLNLVNALCMGWLSSGTSYVLSNLFGDFGIRIDKGEE